MKRIIYLLLFGVVATVFGAEVIPSNRRYDWQPGVNVGIPGGIPVISTAQLIDATQAPYNADNTGVSDAHAAILAAGAAAFADPGTYRGVYLPAGTYRLVAGPVYAYTGQIVRGAGKGVTILKPEGATNGLIVGGGPGDPSWASGATISGSPAVGATTIDVADSSIWTNYVGYMLNVTQKNDTTVPVLSVAGYEFVREQKVILESIADSNTLNISPPLAIGLSASLNPKFTVATTNPGSLADAQRNNAGAESLTVDAENTSGSAVGMSNAYRCWLYDVRVLNALNYHIETSHTLQCEIRKCDAWFRRNTGTNGGGILAGRWWNGLIVNNTFTGMFPSIEMNFGCGGNVIIYNYVDESLSGHDTGDIGGSININHGAHSEFILVEGNVVPRIQADGYFGSIAKCTIFRNWTHGTSQFSTSARIPMTFNRFTRDFNIVANLVGRTGLGIAWDYTNAGFNYDTTSSTSNSIGTGSKSFTVGTGLAANTAGGVYLIYSAGDITKWMTGRVTAYDSVSGAITMTINRTNGSGTFTDWVFRGGSGYGCDSSTTWPAV